MILFGAIALPGALPCECNSTHNMVIVLGMYCRVCCISMFAHHTGAMDS